MGGHCDHALLVDLRVDYADFGRFGPERELLVVPLKVVQAVHALIIENDELFFVGPSDSDEPSLVPL